MAKKKDIEKEIFDLGVYDTNIEANDIVNYNMQGMGRFGVNVAVLRIAPNLLDGLTPVRRRILYAMYNDLKLFPNKARTKVDEIKGKVTGSYHPHGPQSVEDALTLMGRKSDNNAVLIDSKGNFGTTVDPSASAGRYLEARLSHYAMMCFFDEFDPDVVDMAPNFTRTTMEPVFLPSKYPNFLINGSSGIGIGFTSNFAPYNLNEVFGLTMSLMEKPTMRKVFLYPDSPRKYIVVDNGTIKDVCETGNGPIPMRADIRYDKDGHYLEITSLPEQVTLDKIEEKIIELRKKNLLPGIKDVKDDCEHINGDVVLNYKILLKKEADPHEIMDILYKKTTLQSSISTAWNFAERTSLLHLGLKPALLEWSDRRLDIKRRIYTKKLKSLRERDHSLNILLRILSDDNFERTSNIMRKAQNTQTAVDALVDTYGITTYQARVITDMRMSQLTVESRAKYADEKLQVGKGISEFESIVRSKDNIKNIVIKELEDGMKLFGKPRQCPIMTKEQLSRPITQHSIVVTKRYIKKLAARCTNPGLLSPDDDVVVQFSSLPNNTKVHLIDEFGKVYTVILEKLYADELASKGTSLQDLLGLRCDIVSAFATVPVEECDDKYLLLFTESGVVKKTPLEQYVQSKGELQGIMLNEGDKVCYTCITTDDMELLTYTSDGYAMSIKVEDINSTARISKGSVFIKLNKEAKVAGVCDPQDSIELFVLTEKGKGKVCGMDDIFKVKKKSDMIKIIGLEDGDKLFKVVPVELGMKLKVFNQSENTVIEVDDVSRETRISKGKKLVPVKRGDSIVKIKRM